MLFYVADRLHLSVVAVERMSLREVNGWVAWFGEAQQPADDAVDPRTMTPQQLRGMFK